MGSRPLAELWQNYNLECINCRHKRLFKCPILDWPPPFRGASDPRSGHFVTLSQSSALKFINCLATDVAKWHHFLNVKSGNSHHLFEEASD
jgi:hypothetical protein